VIAECEERLGWSRFGYCVENVQFGYRNDHFDVAGKFCMMKEETAAADIAYIDSSCL